MAKSSIKFPGVGPYIAQLNRLSDMSLIIIERAVAKGAKPVADACKENLKGLSARSNYAAINAWKQGRKSPLTEEQKKGLVESMGLAPIRDDKGYINTKLGFDGYNEVVTKRWPKGQPNALIARVLESGSSAMDKQPFVRPAVLATRKDAEKEMKKYLDDEIGKIMK